MEKAEKVPALFSLHDLKLFMKRLLLDLIAAFFAELFLCKTLIKARWLWRVEKSLLHKLI